jgi:endonuclease/exonuclease/phosphatase family metal-dependent hydrolase
VPPFAARIAALRAQLARLDADVLCLQEIAARHEDGKHAPRRLRALDTLLAGTPYASFERVASSARDGHGPLDVHNLAILSRFKIEAHRQYWHDFVDPITYRIATAAPPVTGTTAIEWDRPVLHATLAAPDGGDVDVFNLHLRAPLAAFIPGQKDSPFAWRTTSAWAEGFFLAAVKRAGQALETRLAIDALFDRDPRARIVVCGDMNAEEREMPLRILRADEADTGSPALAGRALIPLERDLPEARRFSVLHAGRPAMIDHLLVSQAMMASYRSLEVFNQRLEDEAFAGSGGPVSLDSYHAPVVASFDIQAQRLPGEAMRRQGGE